jgi:hypothetical protein
MFTVTVFTTNDLTIPQTSNAHAVAFKLHRLVVVLPEDVRPVCPKIKL